MKYDINVRILPNHVLKVDYIRHEIRVKKIAGYLAINR